MMSERLLFPSRVLLYGRVVVDLTIGPQAGITEDVPLLGANTFLQQQIAPSATAPPQIARIYGFSYEGHYYDLARPALFLVHGPGVDADPVPGTPANVDRSGVGATAKTFPGDMKVWAYDKGDFSIRLDVETGTLEQILLHVELSTDRLGMTFSGKTVRLRGPLGVGD